MKKIFATVAIGMLSFCSMQSFAQSTNEISERSSFMDRVYTGGGLGMSFGSGISYVQVSPMIGYRVTNELSAGSAFSYRYTKYKGLYDISTSNYGINPFVRYNIIAPFFLQAEYEYLSFEYPTAVINNEVITERKGFSSMLVGGGISQPVGGRAFFNITALYNLSYVSNSSNTPYNSPLVIRAGITLGF